MLNKTICHQCKMNFYKLWININSTILEPCTFYADRFEEEWNQGKVRCHYSPDLNTIEEAEKLMSITIIPNECPFKLEHIVS